MIHSDRKSWLLTKGLLRGTQHHTQYKNDDSWKARFGGPSLWAKKSPLRMRATKKSGDMS